MFKFIVLSLLGVTGAGCVLGALITTLGLGFYSSFALITIAAIVMASYVIIPTGKNVLTGSAVNTLGGGRSGGYNKVS
jgi:hypothetical protein